MLPPDALKKAVPRTSELQPWLAADGPPDRFRQHWTRFLSASAQMEFNCDVAGGAVEPFLEDGNWMMRFDWSEVEPEDIAVWVTGNALPVRGVARSSVATS